MLPRTDGNTFPSFVGRSLLVTCVTQLNIWHSCHACIGGPLSLSFCCLCCEAVPVARIPCALHELKHASRTTCVELDENRRTQQH